jgi:hypothetical protein
LVGKCRERLETAARIELVVFYGRLRDAAPARSMVPLTMTIQ